MGKKKAQQHATENFGGLVAKAALDRLQPFLKAMMDELGQDLRLQQQSTFQMIYTRLVAVEQLLIEKNVTTKDELSSRVADLEDVREQLTKADVVKSGDVVRLQIRTKTNDQTEFQGSSGLKLYRTGSGNTLGLELETAIVDMKVDEVKEVTFGQNKELMAEITVNRIARPIPPPVAPLAVVPESTPEGPSDVDSSVQE